MPYRPFACHRHIRRHRIQPIDNALVSSVSPPQPSGFIRIFQDSLICDLTTVDSMSCGFVRLLYDTLQPPTSHGSSRIPLKVFSAMVGTQARLPRSARPGIAVHSEKSCGHCMISAIFDIASRICTRGSLRSTNLKRGVCVAVCRRVPRWVMSHYQQNLKTMRGAKSDALFLTGADSDPTCPCLALSFAQNPALLPQRWRRTPSRIALSRGVELRNEVSRFLGMCGAGRGVEPPRAEALTMRAHLFDHSG